MKVCDLIDEMAFSHRPVDGISVGVAVIAGVAYMAVGFVRDGDCFNRKLARHILAQRIISTVTDNKNVKLVHVIEQVPEHVDARGVVRMLRVAFKPDPTCNDATFMHSNQFLGNMTVRSPMSRDEQWRLIVQMFESAVALTPDTRSKA